MFTPPPPSTLRNTWMALTGKKGIFLYSAVSSPLDRSKRFTLFLPWQTCSFRHQLDSSGKHSCHAAITHKDYITHISTTAQILIYTADWTEWPGASWREQKCPNFESVAKRNSIPGSPDCKSDILPLNCRAPQTHITVLTQSGRN